MPVVKGEWIENTEDKFNSAGSSPLCRKSDKVGIVECDAGGG